MVVCQICATQRPGEYKLIKSRLLKQGAFYICDHCYEDLQEHFAERRSHGPTG